MINREQIPYVKALRTCVMLGAMQRFASPACSNEAFFRPQVGEIFGLAMMKWRSRSRHKFENKAGG